MNFHHQLITPEWPQANATCERLMSSINKRIRCAQVDKQDWKLSLKAFVERYRATPHVSRGHTPNELMGLTDNNLLPSKLLSVPVSDLIESAKISDANAKRIQKKYADMHKKKRPIFEIGDIVLCRQKTPTKHTPYFNTEPYTITAIKGTMVTAKNTTHTITRNESYFKWFNGVIPTRQTIVNSLPYLFIQPVSLLIERITPPPLTPTEPATPSTTQPPQPFTQQTQNKSKNSTKLIAVQLVKKARRGRPPKKKNKNGKVWKNLEKPRSTTVTKSPKTPPPPRTFYQRNAKSKNAH